MSKTKKKGKAGSKASRVSKSRSKGAAAQNMKKKVWKHQGR